MRHYYDINDMNKLAEKRGGRCLSKEYVNNKTKLIWQCEKGHKWYAKPNSITSGNWCPKCAKKEKHTIEEMQELAQKKNGKCLSKVYKNTKSKLDWQCQVGHEWKTTPGVILRGAWCPICSAGISERICRKYFENLFKEEFIKAKPTWLINSKGNLMELDGYCEKLNLAFEYQGIQHYKYNKRFHNSISVFNQRKKDDELKRELCKKNNVVLIEVPHDITYEEMGEFIIAKLSLNGLAVNGATNISDYSSFNVFSPLKIEEIKKLAESKDGKCLSDNYVNSTTKLIWQCKRGHIWKAIPISVQRGSWCPFCVGKNQTIEDMQNLARLRDGKCLSTRFINSNTKLLWECKKGHNWKAISSSIKRGSWCPHCSSNKKISLTEMQEFAINKGGKLISGVVSNNKIKVKWLCAEGHSWNAAYDRIKNGGTWCPVCSRKKVAESHRLSIEDMQIIAKSKKGRCLSKEYINSETKLEWECEQKHTWFARPSKIMWGQWCPHCSSTKLSIEEMNKLAEKKEGACLSRVYVNNYTKLKWRCKNGHIWYATPHNIKKGTWCSSCRRR